MNPFSSRVIRTALAFTTACFILAGPAAARTFYVAPDGNDDAATEQGAVFRTLRTAVNNIWGGDTLIIRNGFYQGGVFIRRGCSAEAPLVIKGESRYAIIVGSGDQRDGLSLNDCRNVILDGVNVTRAARGGIVLDHSRFVTIRNCVSYNNVKWGIFTDHSPDILVENNECFGSQVEHGIYHSNGGGDRFIIRGNYLHHNSGCGIHVNGDPEYGDDGVLSYGIIERNLIVANGATLGGAGINMTHVQDVIVRNNLLYNNMGGSITFYQDSGTFEQGSKRALITGNTVVFKPGQGRSGVNIMPTSEKALICGNIFVSGGSRGCIEVESEHLPTVLSDNNVIWGIATSGIVERTLERRIALQAWRELSGNDTHTVVAEPGFIAPEYGNFHLKKNSPAVGAAMSLEAIKASLKKLGGYNWTLEQLEKLPDEDFDGHARKSAKGRCAGAFILGD